MTSFLTKGLFKYKAGATDAFGCSAVSAKNKDGGYIFGRNFDWLDCTALIVKTIPIVGYTSISTTNVNFLGLEYGAKPKGIIDKMTMLGSTYAPLDGMNEKGLWS